VLILYKYMYLFTKTGMYPAFPNRSFGTRAAVSLLHPVLNSYY